MTFAGTIEDKDEWLKSELPALEQLYAMEYEYKSQAELNKTRRDYPEVLLYDRLEAAIRKLNPEIDEDKNNQFYRLKNRARIIKIVSKYKITV